MQTTRIAKLIDQITGRSRLGEPTSSTDQQWQAALRLSRIGAPAIQAVLTLLKHDDPYVRITGHHLLREMGPRAAPAIAAMIENFTHDEMWVRKTAIGGLGYLGPEVVEAVPALIDRIAGDADPQCRTAAAWVIHHVAVQAAARFPQTVAALAAALDDPERTVRLNAAAALGAMGVAAMPALPALIQALRHKHQHTRIYAGRAIGELGPAAAKSTPFLRQVLKTISDDEQARHVILCTLQKLTGQEERLPPQPPPPVQARPWAGLQRRDFHLACQPIQTQRRTVDQDQLYQAFLDEKVCNAFCFWPDHTWHDVPIPTPDQMKRWNMTAFWYFFTEDIYNPKQQRDWGFRSLDEYNLAVVDHIRRMGQALGAGRCVWSVGHEHMDAGKAWGADELGNRRTPRYTTKRGGYTFYRRWITTNLHQRHWSGAGNHRPNKFYAGWNPGADVTWRFIDQHQIDLSNVQMMSGGVCPVLAHAAFDILPQIDWYWWECQVDGTSVQIGSAYTRGAARQYDRKWLLDASPWSPVLGEMDFDEQGNNIAGVTDSQQMRTWIYGYLAGADCVFEEASGLTHFHRLGEPVGNLDDHDQAPARLALTSTGKMAQQVADFCFRRCPQRGRPYTPVGVILEHHNGYEPRPHTNFRGCGPWFVLPRSPGEWEIERFWQAVYPNHSVEPDQKQLPPDATDEDREPQCLHGSVMGDVFDVLTDRCPAKVLDAYPRLITLGGIVIGKRVLERLMRYVEKGGQLMVNAAHLPQQLITPQRFGVEPIVWDRSKKNAADLALLRVDNKSAQPLLADDQGRPLIVQHQLGKGAVTLVTVRHGLTGLPIGETSRYLPDLLEFLKQWVVPVYPLRVNTSRGNLPQYALNRLADGWLVTIGNHYRQPWQGVVQLQMQRATSISERWTQTPIDFDVVDSTLRFQAQAPGYAFRIYHVQCQ